MDVRRRMLFKKKASSSGGSTTGGSYIVNLNGQWEATTAVTNPDSTLYDGVYRSVSNYNVHNGVATMYITIKDCSSFKMYIRSYAESVCDYVMVSQLDKTITGSSSYSDTTLVKAHTRGNQQSGTALSSYTLVEFTGITSGEHTITVVYRKDSSVNSGDDRGYVLIEKTQAGSGDSGGDDKGPINIDNYLTIESLRDGLTASLSMNACEYCVDGDGQWKTLAAGTATEAINTGQTLSFRGNITPKSSNGIGTFTISKKCNLKGNCMSMLFGNNAANNFSLSGKNYAFYKLFYNCAYIITVSDNFLPATTVSSDCYKNMFNGCTSLITPPKLPATVLADSCYYYMFSDCTSLTTAPDLPATTLYRYCYNHMFYGCSNLTTAPKLSATTSAAYCCYYMFYGCTSLTTAPELYATTLAEDCYASMFSGCTSLVSAPNLPATTLAKYCYYYMFEDCSNLKNIPSVLPAMTLKEYCYHGMFSGCNSLTSTPELPATTLAENCYSVMFYDCDNIVNVTKLPATTLAKSCYSGMFSRCSNLTSAPVLPATTLAESCYSSMFRECSILTTAPKLPATVLATSCYSQMFMSCYKLTSAPSLLAPTLTNNCYYWMFYGCSKLNYIEMLATDISASSCLSSWVYNVAKTGVLIKHRDMTSLPTGVNGVPENWKVSLVNINNYLTIEALEDGLTVSLSASACEYCVDGDGNWKNLAAGTTTESINTGQTLSFRGNLTPTSSAGIGTFTINKKCDLTGNCMSMLFGNNAANNYSLSGKSYAFYKLFYNCSNIVNVSSNFLPATTLAGDCYRKMFQGCTNLAISPKLPATTLASYCYQYMFSGCTGIVNAPELPATTLATWCYSNMFSGCTGIVNAPELPATTLKIACYDYMFEGCTNLTQSPELPATTLVTWCYRSMFNSCSKLNYIKMLATDISENNYCLDGWVYNVASSGTFVKNPNMNSIPTGTDGIPSGWTIINDGEPVIDINNYLTIEALEDGLTASLSMNACEYCVDGDGNWKNLAAGTTTQSINTGQTLSFRGNVSTTPQKGSGTFTISKKCNLKGNCMSIKYGDDGYKEYYLGSNFDFYKLFYNCVNIITVSKNFLPATRVAYCSYGHMFDGCSSLTTAPELPSTNLSGGSYEYMFNGCTSLINPPELPATSISVGSTDEGVYMGMFRNCTSLTTAPELPATYINCWHCYQSMFEGCINLVNAPSVLPATTIQYSAYVSMFEGCTSLVNPPIIKVKYFGSYYGHMYRMFKNCTSLVSAPELPATSLSESCYSQMFVGCTSLTTAPKLPATTLAEYCYGNMFNGCTSLTTAPELPATKLVANCYDGMFDGCIELNYIKMLATDVSAEECLYNWVSGVSSDGVFVKNPNMSTLPTGDSGIPSGWTVVNDEGQGGHTGGEDH